MKTTGIAFALLILISCNSSPGNSKTSERNGHTVKSVKELLQGKWQSQEDQNNYVEFKGNIRSEIGEGMTAPEEETFFLSDKCSNESDKETVKESDPDNYITCIQSDMCWHIDKIDENTLMLTYVGRGNTLTYKRTK